VRRLLVVVLALAALAVPPLAYADAGLTPVEPASPNAEQIEDSYWTILILTTLVMLSVFVPLAIFIVRYRSRGRGREIEGPQIRGNTRLEMGWTLAPVIILVIIVTGVLISMGSIRNVETAEGAEPLTIRVEGRQFYWNFIYPNGVVAVDRMTIPVGRPVKWEITAPEGDVIHSFWVPALQGKFDAIPGQTVSTTIEANRVGVFEGTCAELCGIEHAGMRTAVEAVSPEEFDRWYASGDRDEELGKITYEGACAKCHGYDAEGDVGPRLAQNPIVSQRDTVEDVVRNGRSAMPSVGDGWSDEQMNALLDYLEETYAPKAGDGDS
jgi:cytochrome c oxidase subunit II